MNPREVIMLSFFFLGAIIGSFLNVVIVRLPRGGSLNEPKRSSCPHCHRTIPWWENIPILSWVFLRGRCSGCRQKISIQYPLIELATGLIFSSCYVFFPWPLAIAYIIFISLLLVAAVIDLQHWIIPNGITLGGIIAGVLLSGMFPSMMETSSREYAMLFSVATAAAGYGLLWAILEMGKRVFGKKKTLFREPLLLRLTNREKPQLHLGEEEIALEELLLRPSDKIAAHAPALKIGGRHFSDQHFCLDQQGIYLAQEFWPLEQISSFEAKVTEIVLPREAMGFGDVKFLSCIGAFLGWKGMLFSLFGGSILGSLAALVLLLITRGRMGRSIPFGPALASAAVLWLSHTVRMMG